jgi:arginyl-tRNA synthetase
MNTKLLLKQKILDALANLKVTVSEDSIIVERPAQTTHGEYATPIALTIFSKLKHEESQSTYRSPRELAENISTKLIEQLGDKSDSQYIKSVSVAGPGFINFTLTDKFYYQIAISIATSLGSVYKPTKSAGSTIIEYVSPNTNKPLHIGHVRNAALGSAMGRILEQVGWDVRLAIINNDRGLHITKSMWAYLAFGKKQQFTADTTTLVPGMAWQTQLQEWTAHKEQWLTPMDMPEERTRKSDHFVGYWYQKGDLFAEDAAVQKIWSEMLQAWEGKELAYHTEVRALWQYLNAYFYEGFTETAAILGAVFDPEEVNYESQIYEAGKEIVQRSAEQGIFEKLPDGAIKVSLEKYALPDKILLRKDGTGIYMTFDIELTRRRFEKDVARVVWVVGMDQQLYFQQLFAVAQLLGYGNQEKFHHFAYGMVRLPEGKMSSRKGRVVYADDLLEMAQDKAREIMQEVGVAKNLAPDEFAQVVQAVGVGAVKWTMLAQDATSEITFDIAESVSFTGFAGPYIQYTLARTYSVFKKVEADASTVPFDTEENIARYFDAPPNAEEHDILVALSKYFDVVEKAAAEFAPHTIATYLHELAQRFNTLYAQHTIVGENQSDTARRLLLTKAVQNVLREGLYLLGIRPVERM